MKKIAIQGGYGAFHEIAAIHYFKDEKIEIVPRNTFKGLFESLKAQQSNYGIMAIENSIAGSILPNYGLLKDSNMQVIGEIYLQIQQNLITYPGQKIEDIKEVYSHPMAILQCQNFFDQYPHIKLIDSIDTALSVKDIADKKQLGVGAIASNLAAEKYNLEIMNKSIETNKKNYTRFLILTDKNGKKEKNEVNKSSIYFDLAHKTGSLSKILSILSYYDMNLTKIQSMPIVGKTWEYQFYADIVFDDYKTYKQSLDAIKPFTSTLGILGEYMKGESIVY